jgi:hypothetical protein
MEKSIFLEWNNFAHSHFYIGDPDVKLQFKQERRRFLYRSYRLASLRGQCRLSWLISLRGIFVSPGQWQDDFFQQVTTPSYQTLIYKIFIIILLSHSTLLTFMFEKALFSKHRIEQSNLGGVWCMVSGMWFKQPIGLENRWTPELIWVSVCAEFAAQEPFWITHNPSIVMK